MSEMRDSAQAAPEHLIVQLDAISRQIQSWLDWDQKNRASTRPALMTDDGTHIMALPVPFWPTHGVFKSWIKLFDECSEALAAQRPAAPIKDDAYGALCAASWPTARPPIAPVETVLPNQHCDASKWPSKADIEPAAPVETKRCEVCGWPLAESREKGCVLGDCSYRPDDPAEQRRISERRAQLRARSSAENTKAVTK